MGEMPSLLRTIAAEFEQDWTVNNGQGKWQRSWRAQGSPWVPKAVFTLGVVLMGEGGLQLDGASICPFFKQEETNLSSRLV